MSRFLFLSWLFFLMSCRSSKITQRTFSNPAAYSIIYVIHSDANYLYHNKEGQARQADKRVLQTAKSVARQAKHGEVFIFYQQPEHKILWLFPKKDRQFFHYRNGNLVQHRNYSPHSSTDSFVTESTFYHKYSTYGPSTDTEKIFLYFGHEVPEQTNHRYHQSRPNTPFDTHIFAQGIHSFLNSEQSPFNLIVLSTCNNGTPSMAQALSPYTYYLLASPQNLHLSYIDTNQLSHLLEQHKISTSQIADSLATHTYRRLSSFLQTAITLSVYNIQEIKTYLPNLAHSYNKYRQNLSSNSLLNDNRDCSRLNFFNTSDDTTGIKRWYKAPKFGRRKKMVISYSGWGCK